MICWPANVKVALANPDQAAIGRATKRLLEQVAAGDGTLWRQLEQHVTKHGVFKPTVNEVATDIRIGSVDAGIVWDATVAMPSFRGELKAIPAPELEGDPDLVSVCVLNSSPQPTAALKFARYLSARDRGLPVVREIWLETGRRRSLGRASGGHLLLRLRQSPRGRSRSSPISRSGRTRSSTPSTTAAAS